MLGCIQPMSSAMMNTMLGFCCGACAGPGACASAELTSAGSPDRSSPAHTAPRITRLRCLLFIHSSALIRAMSLTGRHVPDAEAIVAKSSVYPLSAKIRKIRPPGLVATPRAAGRRGRRFRHTAGAEHSRYRGCTLGRRGRRHCSPGEYPVTSHRYRRRDARSRPLSRWRRIMRKNSGTEAEGGPCRLQRLVLRAVVEVRSGSRAAVARCGEKVSLAPESRPTASSINHLLSAICRHLANLP